MSAAVDRAGSAHGGRIEGLQVLRAVAALMVGVRHAQLSVPGAPGWLDVGDLGVDIFFVISGFVMAYTTWTVEDGLALRRRLSAAKNFLIKRVFRIVPLYWLGLLWAARGGLGHAAVWPGLGRDVVFIPHPTLARPD